MSHRIHIFTFLTACLLFASGKAESQQVQNAALPTSRDILAALVPGGNEMGVKCGLPAIAAALQNRQNLTPAQLAALRSVLQRPTLQKQITAGHFTVHYDTAETSVNTPALLDAAHQRISGTADAYAESVTVIANHVWAVDVDVMGYAAPPADAAGGGPEYDIYIEDLANAYGETDPEVPLDTKGNGGRFTTFITIDNDFSFVSPVENKGMPGLRVTLAHEFHHAIQIGAYGYWYTDQYFYEITSTWMEDLLYPDVNDYLLYMRSSTGQFAMPQVAFTANTLVMYSRGIWAQFVAKRFGTETMRRAWEQIPLGRPLVAMDAALAAAGSSMRAAFIEWELWNFYTAWRSTTAYYTDALLFPPVTESAVDFTSPSRVIQQNVECLGARYIEIRNGADTTDLIVVNVNMQGAEAGQTGPYAFTLRVRDTQDEGFAPAGAGLYEYLDVPDPSNWKVWAIERGKPAPGLKVTEPFPQPFRANGANTVHIPAPAAEGHLTIFSSAMELIYSGTISSHDLAGAQVFSWDGRTTSGALTASGIYFYALEIPGKTLKGKLVVIRK